MAGSKTQPERVFAALEHDGVYATENGGWKWKKTEKVKFRVQGNELHLAIPRTALTQGKGKQPVKLDFKWADNLQQPGEVMDFFVSGDVAASPTSPT